jgi:hypothetical protein
MTSPVVSERKVNEPKPRRIPSRQIEARYDRIQVDGLPVANLSNHQFTDDLDAESKQLEVAKRKLKATRRP